jgi:predicted transposase YdaD
LKSAQPNSFGDPTSKIIRTKYTRSVTQVEQSACFTSVKPNPVLPKKEERKKERKKEGRKEGRTKGKKEKTKTQAKQIFT